MLTFLRKIRRSLIESGSARKYLLYAIGEIALVVIGILLALYINNGNIANQNEVKFEALFREVLDDLTIDINEANRVIEFDTEKDSLLTNVIDGKVTAKDYERGNGYLSLVIRYDNMAFSDNGYNNLTRDLDKIPEKYSEVLNKLNKLHLDYKNSINKTNGKLSDIVSETLKNWAKTKPWFSQFHMYKSTEDAVKYFLADPLYKNNAALFQTYLSHNHLPMVKKFKHQAVKCYIAISKILEPQNLLPELITSYMVDLSPNILEQYIGDYKNEFGVVQLTTEEGDLFLMIEGDEDKTELFPKSDTTFSAFELPMSIVMNKDTTDEVSGFTLKMQGQEVPFLKLD